MADTNALEKVLGVAGLPRALIEQSPLSTVIYDMAGRIVFANAAFDRLWGGQSALAPVGYSVLHDPQLGAPEVRSQIERAFRGEVVTTPPVRYDAANVVAGGRAVWTMGHFYPLFDATGVQHAVALIHINLTPRVDAEEALRHSEHRLRMALDAGQMGTWEWVIDEDHVSWSETLEQIHGLQSGTFGGTFAAFEKDIHPEDRERVFRAIGRTIEGADHHMSYRIVRPDGTERWVEAHGRLIRDETGKPERLVGVCADVTDKHRADAATQFLIEASEVLASSLDYDVTLSNVARLAVPTLADYCIIDLLEPETEAGIRRVATAHADPAKDVLLSGVRSFPPALDSDGIVARALRARTAVIASPISDVVREASASGRLEHQKILHALAPTSVLCAPLMVRGTTLGTILLAFAESGRAYGNEDIPLALELARRAALAVDGAHLLRATVNARAAAEQAAEEARAANRAKSDFLAVMSHELRTPLNAIGGYAELLALGIHGPVTPEQTDDLERIKRSQRHLLSLINDLLNYAKLEAGHVLYQVEVVPVHTALAGLEPLVAPQFSSKGVEYVFHPVDASWAVRADAEKLRQILVNLLSNAVKFTASGGMVEVSARLDGDHVVMSVSDTGIGIPASKLDLIFEPFVQLSRDLTHSQEGTGLGLAISRDLARAMSGDLAASSTVDRGSVFTLTLPRA
jgi:PAS domain S-box-containing protein